MNSAIAGVTSVIGRVLIAAIFLMSGVGKIPDFNNISLYMASKGVPAPNALLVFAIIFLLVGSVSVILGYKGRIGAAMLFVFLLLATYYFHDFWNLEGEDREREMIHFMKNLAMIGATVFLMANGSGRFSLDRLERKSHTRAEPTPKP